MDKLTFKQYLDSKDVLRKAISEAAVQTITYNVKKYCRIPVGETKEDKQYIMLKPKQKVLVEWKYNEGLTPDVISIQFLDVEDINLDESFDPFWTSQRLQKWLTINTKEELPDLF